MRVEYKTKLTNQKASSETLGRCEVCKKHATEVYILSVWEKYGNGEHDLALRLQRFGHKECLENYDYSFIK